jgi:hypothetical protein
MSFAAFRLFLATGAALLAAWVIDRFPDRSPNQLRQALIHFTFSLALVWAGPSVFGPFATGGSLTASAAAYLRLAFGRVGSEARSRGRHALMFGIPRICQRNMVGCACGIPRSGGRSRFRRPMESQWCFT